VAAAVPTTVRVRMYQVGFGDCFLVSFEYATPLDDGRSERHILFDFGSTHAPRARVTSLLPNVGKLIETHCGGQLDVLVATHRHKDHIDGFGNKDAAEVIGRLEPKLVVRPWTEDPKLPADSTALAAGAAPSERYAASLGEAQGYAELARSLVSQNGRRPRGIAGDLAELAANQVPNQEALDNLDKWADAGDFEFLHAGVKTKIPKFVPGITVRVLGPPTVEQEPDVVRQRANDDEFWLTQRALLEGGERPLDALVDVSGEEDVAVEMSGPVRWLRQRMDRQRVASMLRLVHTLDAALNNTSVVLLIDAGDKRMLFPGDAQIENWSYTLEHAKGRQKILDLLEDVDLYKVGHHGSRNATPRSLFKYWGSEPDPQRPMVALMSTRRGVHGKSTATAVPRATLISALQRRMTLFSTDDAQDFPAGQRFLEIAAPTAGKAPFKEVNGA
jgi:beta-lactamase superfamily II metal-dependent hydrolase